MSDLEIAAAVPDGSRWVRSQKLFMERFVRQPELAALNKQGHTVCEIIRYIARWAYEGRGISMPVRARLCRELGISVTTWKRWRKWIQDRGWLGTVRPGWKPGIMRAASLDDDEPNEAAIYVLCIPAACEKSKTPRPANHTKPENGPLRRPPSETESSYGSTWTAQPRKRPPLPAPVAAIVHVLRRGPLKTLTERWCAWLGRPWIRAGWLPADFAAAVDHHPADGRYGGSWDDVRNPGPLLAWRLSRWTADPDKAWAHWREHGRWPAGLEVAASQSQRQWAGTTPPGQQYLQRNRRQAAAARRPDPHPIAAAIRRQLGWPQPQGER